ncbi:hypothetical protein Hanom_Chr06g00523931 [Helianthus anomalus]
MKQLEDAPKEKSRALVVIHDDEGFDWSELLPEEDAIGYAFVVEKIIPFKDTRNDEEKYLSRKCRAEYKMIRLSKIFSEAKREKRWDADRECYLGPQGNIAIDTKTLKNGGEV